MGQIREVERSVLVTRILPAVRAIRPGNEKPTERTEVAPFLRLCFSTPSVAVHPIMAMKLSWRLGHAVPANISNFSGTFMHK